jgi:hypothetical protein
MSIVTCSNESGDSKEHAVKVLGAGNERAGIQAEYQYLCRMFGEQGKDWNLAIQSLMEDKDSGKVYDRMDLDFPNQPSKTLYFDITEFYGKF